MSSTLERCLELQLEQHGITDYEREFHYKLPGTRNPCRFDFAWPEHMLAVEVQGGLYPTNHRTKSGHSYKRVGSHVSAAGYTKDRAKYNEAALMGWTVIEVTDKHLVPDYTNYSTAVNWIERFLSGCEDEE